MLASWCKRQIYEGGQRRKWRPFQTIREIQNPTLSYSLRLSLYRVREPKRPAPLQLNSRSLSRPRAVRIFGLLCCESVRSGFAVWLSVCLSSWLTVWLAVWLLSVCLATIQFEKVVWLAVWLPVSLAVWLSSWLSGWLSVCLSRWLSVWLSAWLVLWMVGCLAEMLETIRRT